MPALGGGCVAVGVRHCAEGFFPDGEGGCQPLLPPGGEVCSPGTMEQIGREACQPVGVIQCAEGFWPDGEGGCDAILPPSQEPCPSGSIARIGELSCQPLGDCGPDPASGGSPWGLIVVDGATVFVDATADATGATGTQAAPYPTIGEALGVVPSGGQVAMAAGVYEEVLVLSRPVRLVGRCAELVILRGRVQLGQPRPPLTIGSGADGSLVAGVTVTGPGEGLVVVGANEVRIEAVAVLGTGSHGVRLGEGAEATLHRVSLREGTTAGVFSQDSVLRLTQSVVRGTLPEPGTQKYGMGILAFCSLPGACGSLHVDRSLVTDNRQAGIFASGVEAQVMSSVVWGTGAQASNRALGVGIVAQCEDPVSVCGRLRVEGSLVAHNRSVGISASGVDAHVLSTVVRDTQAEEGSGERGWGIEAKCSERLGVCGALQVEASLVSGSRDVGILSSVETQVRGSVVRSTEAEEKHLTGGMGIAAWHDERVEVRGGLFVEDSLVEGNRHVGIFVSGVDAVVQGSVVRDTRCQESDSELGTGIAAQCRLSSDACGSLRVEGTLVTGNRYLGVLTAGVDTQVMASVVRDTLPAESDQTFGAGIGARCHPELGVCGALLVEGSLIAGNRFEGIITAGVHAQVMSTVVRDTLPQESDQGFGRGIDAQCNVGLRLCGSLHVEESLVSGSRNVGIFSAVDTTVLSTVVRDTGPDARDQRGGRGINVQCDHRIGFCGRLVLKGSLVARSEDTGVFIAGMPAELHGVVVSHTRAGEAGPDAGTHGQGIWALCHPATGNCGSFSLSASLVEWSHGAGVALEGVSGLLMSSRIHAVLPQPLDGKYGYGIQIGGLEGEALPTVHVQHCGVQDASLAGLLYARARGALTGSAVSGGDFSVAMTEGSLPVIGADNRLSGNIKSEPEWASLSPSPAPAPQLPSTAWE